MEKILVVGWRINWLIGVDGIGKVFVVNGKKLYILFVEVVLL